MYLGENPDLSPLTDFDIELGLETTTSDPPTDTENLFTNTHMQETVHKNRRAQQKRTIRQKSSSGGINHSLG